MSKDYYNILGVEKNATQDEIKKAFRKVAHTHHPDKPGGDEAKFKEANEAYQTLGDEKKRAQYDQFGAAGPNMGGFGGGAGQGFGGFGGAGGFDFGDIDLGDLFGGGFGGSRQRRQRKGQDLQTRMHITFKESIFGVKKSINVEHNKTCGDCAGSGGEKGTSMETCSECHGQGQTQQRMMGIFATIATCPVCQGKGTLPKTKCRTCRGAGITREKEVVEFTIPAGINHGDTLRISGKGEAIPDGPSGDLFVQMFVEPHKDFSRKDYDLLITQEITVSEAILGATREIKMLDDTKIEIKIPNGTQSGAILRVSGRGIAGRGNLMVTIKIHIPKRLSKAAKSALEVLQAEGY